MAPEIVRGEKVDARSDIFSLGVILYEMTTGRRPFTAPMADLLIREIAAARPQPPHILVPHLPLELDRIILKALASRPSDRYQTMIDLAVDLKQLAHSLEQGSAPSYDDLKPRPSSLRGRLGFRLAIGVGLVASAALAGAWYISSKGDLGNQNTIMVMPLEMHDSSDRGRYVGRVLAEEIASSLAIAKALKVLTVPDSPGEYGVCSAKTKKDALDSGADYLVCGSVEPVRGVYHLSLSLIDLRQNWLMWGEPIEISEVDRRDKISGLRFKILKELGVPGVESYSSAAAVAGASQQSRMPIAAVGDQGLRSSSVPEPLRPSQ